MNRMLCTGLLALPLLGACKRPEPPPRDRPPEPQATALRDAIQRPLDQAKAVQQAGEQAAAQRNAAIEAATR